MKVICISGKAQNGKDTVAQMIKEELEIKGNKVLISHFADLLKYICYNFFGWNGEKDSAGRSLLQYVGTDVIRKKRPDFWVEFIGSVLDLFSDRWDYILLPDCRFPNEYEYLKNLNYDVCLLRINRENFVSPLSETQQKHYSEIALDNYPSNYYITNDFTLGILRKKVKLFLREYYEIS